MSFPSPQLIYHPILANNGQQQIQGLPQQQHNVLYHNVVQQKPIHIKVLVFEAKKEDLNSERMESLKPISIRRGERSLPNYAELTKYLTEKCSLNLEGALIRYQDDENHWIDISSDEELAYGIQLCRDSRTSASRPVFRIAVLLLKKEEEKPQEKRECPYWKGRRHGGCPYRRRNLPENHPQCPMMFRKTIDGDDVLELDIDVDQLKNGLNVNQFVKEHINNAQIPHFGVTCDGCGKYSFVGKRFKCDDCDDFDFCQDCFASEAVRSNHFGGSHSFQEREPRSACFLRNIFCDKKEEKKAEEETVIDNELYEEPVAVEEPIIVEEPPVIVEEPVVVVEEPIIVEEPPVIVVEPPVIVEEPVVVVEPPVIVEPCAFQTEIALLRDMGFVDEISNLQLLKKYNGDLQRVIVDLIH